MLESITLFQAMPLGCKLVRCDDYDDRACPVCYFSYLKDFLSEGDRVQLFRVSKDCGCDFDEPTYDLSSQDDLEKKAG